MCKREFREYVDNLRSAVIGEALGRLVDASVAAAETQVDIMLRDPDSSVRLRASGMVIDTLIRLREHEDFNRRIRLLEERLNGDAAEDLEGDDPDGVDGGPPGQAGAAGGDADGAVPAWEAELDRS
jgi:hypothetical protein